MRRTRLGQGLLVLAGLINILPGVGALSVSSAESAYGIEIAGADLQVLMRHRAVLLALIGVVCVVGAFRPGWRPAAVFGSGISFGSFLIVVLANTPVNPELTRVAWIDVVALVILGGGAVLARERRPG
ncbi:phosphopantetheine adenylyltransferase [Crossiella cryophila]|uniref:Phosphopantetheine adenylyltransferase n=1 Tax=Crossiella cryophila TaxID=43355 RepID=A0A7W7CA37_9PSEU|nr:phosphopantetheine adenylyltransferase [Crossiella cryophila]MBB4677339.1 hypothetical protein [Crossiella cryophila]